MGEDGKGPGPPQQTGTVVSRIWQIGAIAVVTAIVLAGGFYASSLAHEDAFADEKAFRVLADVVAQVNNFEESRATLLTYMPDKILRLMPACDDPETHEITPPQDARHYAQDLLEFKTYVARLDVRGARLCKLPAQAAQESATRGTTQLARAAQQICSHAPIRSIRLGFSASNELYTARCDQPFHYLLRESFDNGGNRIVAQDYFSEALLAMSDGVVVGELTRHEVSAADSEIILHPAIGDRLNIVDARQLFSGAQAPAAADELANDATTADISAQQQPSPPPPHPSTRRSPPPLTAYTQQIGSQTYRVYMLPFNSQYSISLSSDARVSAPRQTLYAMGIQRMDIAGRIVQILWPFGVWAIALFIILLLLAWPFLSLAFAPAQESISPLQALTCAVSAITIPAVLTIAAASVWSQLELQAWMAADAGEYAAWIEQRLHADLVAGATILNSYRPVYEWYLAGPDGTQSSAPSLSGGSTWKCADLPDPASERETNRPDTRSTAIMPAVLRNCASSAASPILNLKCQSSSNCLPVRACLKGELAALCATGRLVPAVSHADGAGAPSHAVADRTDNWSPFRQITAVNSDGDRFGPVLTAFSPALVGSSLRLASREYFQALKHDQAWSVASAGAEPVDLVAQRVFNRTDASKALQVAVPLPCPRELGGAEKFCGVVTGDMRMYGLMAAIAPPLLSFAVIDTATGTVVFHSSDGRSLAENFLREAEDNPELAGALRARQAARFSGNYQGEPHRFFYRPVRDMPLGVIVFYDCRDLGDLPFSAGWSALCCYALFILTVAGLLVALRGLLAIGDPAVPWGMYFIRRLWPVNPLPGALYRFARLRPSFWSLVVLVAATLAGQSPWLSAALALLALLVVGAAGWLLPAEAAAALATKRLRSESDRCRVRERLVSVFAESVISLLIVLAVLPAYVFFGEFQQSQIEGLVRDGLVTGAYQMQGRHALVQQDLQRWIPPDGQEWEGAEPQYPGAWAIALAPDRGLATLDLSTYFAGTIQRVARAEASHDELLSRAAQQEGTAGRNLRWNVKRAVWRLMSESPVQHRRLRLLDAADPDSGLHCQPAVGKDPESCNLTTGDGGELQLQARGRRSPYLLHESALVLAGGTLTVAVAFLLVWLGALCCARRLAQQVFCLCATYALDAPEPEVSASPDEPDSAKFKKLWGSMPIEQRLVLYQIARHRLVNPDNEAAIEDLLRPSEARPALIHLDPWPQLRWPELRQLILRSESPADLRKLESAATRGPWKSIRGPLFILVMALIAWLCWAAGGSMKALSAVLVATVALLTQFGQLMAFLRQGTSPAQPVHEE